jgi:type VI secretion system secreted protein Hcp
VPPELQFPGIAAIGGAGDMFLKVVGQKAGLIKGESQDDAHKDEIDIAGWSWGMQTSTGLAGAGATGKAAIRELHVVKQVDSASCALMAALRNNEMIKEALLTVRKAGQTQQEFFKIRIQSARIASMDVRTGEGSSPGLVESLSFAFQKITVEYRKQDDKGQALGTMMFETDVA